MSNDTNDLIGEPVFGNGFKKKVNAANAGWKLDKEGDHVYRILPPFGLLAKTGKWSYYEAIHWGYKDSNGKHKPFRCIQRKSKGMIVSECPQCKKITEREEARKAAESKLLTVDKKSKEEVKEMLKPFDAWLSTFNTARGHYLNVIRRDQQIGKLFIKISAMKELETAIKKLMERKTPVNPISASQGAWAVFTRTGTGRYNTEYSVSFYHDTKEIEGIGSVEVLVPAPLTPDIIGRLKEEAFELSTGYRDLTYAEIQMLVGSGGDSSVVDSIFGAPRISKSDPVEEKISFEPEESPAASDDVTEEVVKQLAMARAKVGNSSTPASVKTTVTQTPSNADDFSLDDFTASLK